MTGQKLVRERDWKMVHFEDGGRSHRPACAGGFWALGTGRNHVLPWRLREAQPSKPVADLWPQKSRMLHLCCFKLLFVVIC